MIKQYHHQKESGYQYQALKVLKLDYTLPEQFRQLFLDKQTEWEPENKERLMQLQAFRIHH